MAIASKLEHTVVLIATNDHQTLHIRHWKVTEPRALVVVAHGFGEHSGCYDEVATVVGQGAGVEFIVPDQRGHGHSSGPRGVLGNYQELVDDVETALAWARQSRPGLPIFLMGHSNGGQVALRVVLGSEGPLIAGLILSNPTLRLKMPVPAYKLAIAKILLRFAPRVTLATRLGVERLTRDIEMQRKHKADPFAHGRISAPLFFGMVEGGQLIEARAAEIKLPVLIFLSGSDPVVDPAPTRVFFEHLGAPDKTLKVYNDMLHEPFNEIGREEVYSEFIRWLNTHLNPAFAKPHTVPQSSF